MPHPYHSLSDLVPAYLPELDLVQLTNDDGGESVDTDVYEGQRAKADGEIDGYLGHRYTVPLSSVPELVSDLSARLTVYRLYRRRYPTDTPESVVKDYQMAVRLLRDLAKGIPTLGVQPVPSPNTERTGRVVTHSSVFSRSSLRGF